MIRITMLTALAAAGLMAVPGAASEDRPAPPTKGEVKLAQLLAGRTAGEPLTCVRTTPSENIQVINDTALVVGRGRTIYVNVPRDPGLLDDDDFLLIRRYNGSSLCRLDWIESRDRFGGFYNGNVLLNDFVPYTRAQTGSDEG